MKRIGILYICTGEYHKFWKNFYISSQKYFLNDCEIFYYVFTDNEILLSMKNDNIYPIYQEQLDWPYPTLLRYKIFADNRNILNKVDYLIFCNANLIFKKNIYFDELFYNKSMFATLHPGYFNKSKDKFPDEKNEKSLAYFERSKNSKYVCGGFNGGKCIDFLRMSEEISKNTEIDLEKNIIAIWHDESHFNYFVEKYNELFNIINAGYCYPDNRHLNIEKKILVLDKDKVISIKHKGVIYNIKYYMLKSLKFCLNIVKDKINGIS